MLPKSTLAVGYARAGRLDENLEIQEAAMREWAKKYGYTLLGVFKDDSPDIRSPLSSGVFQALLKFCRDNGVRVLLTQDLSNLGRSLVEALSVVRQLYDEGFTVVFTKYGLRIDPLTIAGRTVLHSLLMAAELEREYLGSKYGGGDNGVKRIGRPPKMVNEKELLMLRRKGLSVRAIAKIMDVSKSTVWRKLKELEQLAQP